MGLSIDLVRPYSRSDMWLSILTQHSALIEITTQGLSCCHGKGVQNSYNPLPQASGKIQLLGLTIK